MESEIELKPCPFCGESELVETSELHYGLYIRRTAGPGGSPEGTWEFYSVECNGCGCNCVLLNGDTPQEAAELWNQRYGDVKQ